MQHVSGEFVIDQYQITLSVINKTPSEVNHLSVTMTLLDAQGRVTGFRQVYLDTQRRLTAGESLALSMRVIPQGQNTVGFEAYAEGYRVEH